MKDNLKVRRCPFCGGSDVEFIRTWGGWEEEPETEWVCLDCGKKIWGEDFQDEYDGENILDNEEDWDFLGGENEK